MIKTDLHEHIQAHYVALRDYSGINLETLIEVSPTTGWRKIFFWRKRVFKPWHEVLQIHIDDHSKCETYEEIERANETSL